MRIFAFDAWRPDPRVVGEVACVPYDTVSREEALALAAGRPRSFLHVVRPDIDLPADTDPHADAIYRTAAGALDRMQRDGSLVQDGDRCLYLYRQRMGEHVQRGMVACCATGDYRANRILKHEKTRSDKEDDRTRHILALRANTGPVFLTYRDSPAVDALVERVECRERPLYDFIADDGVSHTVWRLPGSRPFIEAFETIPVCYIADGHHRAAAAARAADLFSKEHPESGPDAEFKRFLAVLFPASQLRVLPYHRCIHDLNGLDARDFLALIGTRFRVHEAMDPVVPRVGGEAGMFLGDRWYRLSWDPPRTGDPVDGLDVSVLQRQALGPMLGIEDPRTSDRISFVGGIRGTAALEHQVRSGASHVAFSMAPVTVDQMMAIADAGREMPPKSTWFEPKLRSGLLVHPFDIEGG